MRCRIRAHFPRSRAKSGVGAGRARRPFRPTAPLPFRTHVPRADDPPIEQALAPRAGARCRGNGTRVRDAGRGNARSRRHDGAGSPAVPRAPAAAGRPHRRPPAPPATRSSATQAPERHGPPPRPGLPHAGPSPGEQADLTARRRPVWEDGSAGRPGALPGAPDFIASRAALHGRPECVEAVRSGGVRSRDQALRVGAAAEAPWPRKARRRGELGAAVRLALKGRGVGLDRSAGSRQRPEVLPPPDGSDVCRAYLRQRRTRPAANLAHDVSHTYRARRRAPASS